MIEEVLIPVQIERWGRLCIRANEQGQESLGALLKRLLKNSVNKRRTVGDYVLKGARPALGAQGPVNADKVFKFNNTATKESLALLSLKVDAMHKTESRLTRKKRLGQMQKAIREKGRSLKNERSYVLDHKPVPDPNFGPVNQTQAGTLYDNYQLDAQEY